MVGWFKKLHVSLLAQVLRLDTLTASQTVAKNHFCAWRAIKLLKMHNALSTNWTKFGRAAFLIC